MNKNDENNKLKSIALMPYLEFFDETLDINSSENYELSLEVSPDQLSYCILDSIRNKYILIRSYTAEDNKYYNATTIDEIIQKDDFLTRRYKKVFCVMPSMKFTLVPSQLYDPAKKSEYFTFNHNLNNGDLILADKVKNPDSYLIYSAHKLMYDVLKDYYPGINLHHQVKLLLDHISSDRKNMMGYYIHIHVERDYFNMIIFSNNSLKFANSFLYRNISDMMYYALNVFKNIGIGQEETIYFSGITEMYDDINSNFSLYVRHIRFAVPSGNFTFSYVFNDLDLHRYINLFSVINCV